MGRKGFRSRFFLVKVPDRSADTLLAVITFSSSRAVEKGSTHNTGILDCFQGYDVKHTLMCLITSTKLGTKQRH
jgi:hypothetical protein